MDDAAPRSPLHDPAKEPAALRTLLGRTNRDWWPNQLSLDILHQHGAHGVPMGDDFDYGFTRYDTDFDSTIAKVQTDTIPEPLTMAGVFLGISGLAGYVRRRKMA